MIYSKSNIKQYCSLKTYIQPNTTKTKTKTKIKTKSY